jgi:Fic family protein
MNDTNLTPRQNLIINIINRNEDIGRSDIEKELEHVYPSSKPTIARNLSSLLTLKLIRTKGKGRSTRYYPFIVNPLLRHFDLDQYFSLEADQRADIRKGFNFEVFSHLKDLFSEKEIEQIKKVNKNFSEETRKVNTDIYKKELERFTIELAWKSSKIEGNTYSLLDTEALIKQKIEAPGHSREEAVMILNHKQAFDMILQHKKEFKKISLSLIKQLHNSIVQNMSISTGIRSHNVGITGTTYRPLDNKWQIEEALENLIATLKKIIFPLEQALVAGAMISYIQPFADGNKRTSRMLANAILLAHDFYPLSYRSVDEVTYKKALILFYEQNSIYHVKKIFIDQYNFALEAYFK